MTVQQSTRIILDEKDIIEVLAKGFNVPEHQIEMNTSYDDYTGKTNVYFCIEKNA